MHKGKDETIKMFEQLRDSIAFIYNDKNYMNMINKYLQERILYLL